MTGEVVPFGRYKGKPVEDMLADADYMTWVEAQPWFRERYLHLLARRDADAASRTPVHNRLQTLFLNADYRMAFVTFVGIAARMVKYRRSRAEAAVEVAMEDKKRPPLSHEMLQELAQPPVWETWAQFEAHGADVVLSAEVAVPYPEFGKLYDPDISMFTIGKKDTDWPRYTASVSFSTSATRSHIEIKPSVADDYPAILRQMERNRSDYLFTADYIGEGATEAQFVSIFAASGKTVVFKRDVDREVARAMLAKLDEVGVSLTLRPDGKILLGANAAEHPEAVAAAREHRDAIVAYLQEQIREADRAPAIPDDGTL